MGIPLDKLIDTEDNIYEMTCVAIKEANILSSDPATVEQLENNKEKIVSKVLDMVLNKEVEYSPAED